VPELTVTETVASSGSAGSDSEAAPHALTGSGPVPGLWLQQAGFNGTLRAPGDSDSPGAGFPVAFKFKNLSFKTLFLTY
jgi:hypothetical protein